MTTAAAALVGYILGTLPSAQGLGKLWGVDLRRSGSGNPGANNARRVGGIGLAALVLIVEAGKGAAAVLIGQGIDGDVGAVAAGIAAVAGNVYNVWYRFEGGKGLGITAGVLATVWPGALAICILVIALAVAATRSSGLSTLTTIVALDLIGLAWLLFEWPNGWGIDMTELLWLLAVGVTVIIWRKHWADWVVKRRALETRRA